MLLPSAFPCDNAATAMRPSRPKLQSFTAYQSSNTSHSEVAPIPKPSKRQHIISSCRALQSLLGSAIDAIPSPRLLSPRMLTSTSKKEMRNPFEVAFTSSNKKNEAVKIEMPRGKNKRRRSEWDDSDDEADKENASSCLQTPKRMRKVPYDMPLGLTASDFLALEPAAEVSVPDPNADAQGSDRDSGYGPSPPLQPVRRGEKWSLDEDRILVETVLEKLQLTKRAWNDCARRLGKDKDSLGQRWRALIDEGDVGLRRGGRRKRGELEVGTW